MKRILFTVFVTFFLTTPNYAQVKDYLQAISGGHSILLGNPTSTTSAYSLFDSLATVTDSLLAALQKYGINADDYAGLQAAWTTATDNSGILLIPANYSTDSTITWTTGKAPIIDFRDTQIKFVGTLNIHGKEIWLTLGESLATAMAAANTDTSQLVIADSFSVTSNDTLKSNASIRILPGGRINITAGDSLWIQGSFDAGMYKVFSGAGKVFFDDATVPYILPQWWGAKGDNSTDNTTAIQNAIDASIVPQTSNRTTSRVYLPKGIYISDSLNFGAGEFFGDGIHETILKLKANSNAPLIYAASDNGIYLHDFNVDGNKTNQTTAAPLIKMVAIDRSIIKRIYAVSSKGDNFHFESSALELHESQSFSADSNGVYVNSCNPVKLTGCFFNTNGKDGLRAEFLASDVITDQNKVTMYVYNNHFEKNASSEITLNAFDNAIISGNSINPITGDSNVVVIQAGSRFNSITNNAFKYTIDVPTYEAGGGSASDYNIIKLDSSTFGNVYERNLSYGTDAGTGELFLFESQIYDLGQNYGNSPILFKPRQIIGDGGHSAFWWLTRQTTNWITATDAEDLTTASWDTTWIDARANKADVGNPADTAGTATLVDFIANKSSRVTIKVYTNVNGDSVESGDRVVGLIYLRQNGTWAPGKRQDLRLRILTKADSVLEQRAFRYKDKWEPYAVEHIATTSYDSLKFQILKAGFTNTNSAYFWGAFFGEADGMTYVPGGATLEPGLSVLNQRVRRYLSLGNGSTQHHLLSAYDDTPIFALSDIDVNTNVSTAAQAIDTSAVVLDASTTQPQVQLRANDGDASELTVNASDQMVFQNASGGYTFDASVFIQTTDFKFIVFADTLCAVKVSSSDTARVVPSR